ncbi:MAG: ABC transporter permease [Anaerolineae bacterium]|nr:ABC transporter permease [Anaerolineae bacterium]
MNMTVQTSSVDTAPPLWQMRLKLALKNFKSGWAIFKENPIGIIGLVLIVFFALLAALHPILMATAWEPAVYDPITGYDFEILIHPSPPTWIPQPDNPMWEFSFRHVLGTDPLGRDVLSQLMFSTRSEFLLGVGAALVTVLIATTIGAVAAYYGGLVDMIFMRIADVVYMLPFIALLIVLSSLFDFELIHLALVYGVLAGFGGTTIVIKSQALTIKVKAYIEAARIAGGNDLHIIFTHLVPNLLPLSFLYMMFTVTGAIFSEAVLSFFGLLDIRMSWGLMIQTAQAAGYLLNSWKYWYLMFPSGVAITLLCAAFYLVGRALDEVVNPRLRKR